MAITGTATLAGSVVVTQLNFPSTPGLTKTFAGIVTATGGITNNGITIANTAVVNYALSLVTDANISDVSFNALNLTATISFQGIEPGGLTPNQGNVANALNSIYGNGTTLPFMPALMQLPTQGQLTAALSQIAPSGDGATHGAAMQTGATFAGQLLSCRTIGEGDANAIIREGQCLWTRGTIRHASFDHDGLSSRATETAPFVSAGAQFNLGGPWRMGGGIGYETSHFDTNTGITTDTDRLHLGGVLKYNPGPLLLAATVTGAFGWSDTERHVSFGGFTGHANADYDTDYISGRLSAAYLLPFRGMYLKPQVDVAYSHVSRDGYTEHGTGGIALVVASSDDGVWSARPMLEIGTEVPLAGGGVARPYLKGGVTVRDKEGFVTNAAFLDAPDSGSFNVTSRIDRTTADFVAGLDLITPSDTSLRLQYDGQFGDTVQQHIGSAKLSIKY